jgi:dodecin
MEVIMEESVYKFITIGGASPESWEKAAAAAIAEAAKSLKDLRIAEVERMDMQLENGKILNYRTRIRVSFRYHGKEDI